MADTIELATAYVSIVPSFQGGPAAIAAGLTPAAATAGTTAGVAAGGGFAAGFAGKAATGAKIATAGLTVPILAIGAAAFLAAGNVDDAYDNIRVKTGATGDDLAGLQKSFNNVANTVPADFGSVSDAVSSLNQRLGLTGPTLDTLASQVLEAGRLGGVPVDINNATSAFSAFNVKGDATTGAMDDLFRVSQATGVGINDLTGTMSKQGAALAQLGFSFTDSAALIGTLDKAGINSNTVMAGLSKSLVTLSKDGEAPKEAFKRVTGEIQGFIQKGDQAAALQLAGKVFGTRGAAQFVGALQSGKINLDNMTSAAGLTGDSILGVAQETKDFPELLQQLGNTAQLTLAPIGLTLFPAIGSALQAIAPPLQGFANWFASLDQGQMGVLIGIGVALAAIGPILGVVSFATQAFAAGATVVRGVVTAWTAVQWALNAAMAANPIGLVVVALALLVAGVVWAYNNVGWFKDGVNAAWSAISSFTMTVFGAIAGFLSGVWSNIRGFSIAASQGITSFVTGAWNNLRGFTIGVFSAIAGFLAGVWAGIRGVAVGAVSGLVSFVVGGFNNIVSFGRSAFAGLQGFLGGVWGNIVSGASGMVGNVLGFFGGLPGRILGAIGGLGGMLSSAGVSAMQGFIGGITSMAGNIFNAAVDTVKGAIDGVKNFLGIKSPSRLAFGLAVFFGKGLINGLGSMASGVGKAATAMVAPLTAPIPVDIARHAVGAVVGAADAGAGGRSLTVNGDVYGADAEEIMDEIDRRERRKTTLNDLRKLGAGAL